MRARVCVCVRARARFAFKGHVCVRARVWCARVGVCACVCARGVCVRVYARACVRVCVFVRVRGLPARPASTPRHLRPEGNGAMNQPWPFISAPRSESRPRCPPGCSCGPQTPSYATKIAELTKKSRFQENNCLQTKKHHRQTDDGGAPPEVKSFDRTQPPWTASKLFQEKERGCVITEPVCTFSTRSSTLSTSRTNDSMSYYSNSTFRDPKRAT